MIRIESLDFSYPAAQPLFRGFSLQIPEGARWALLGPSGCGKTTLLFLLAGLLKPQSGLLAIRGLPVEAPRPRTGLILQHYGLLPWATIRENILLGLKIRTFYGPDGKHSPSGPLLTKARQQAACDYWLEHLGLRDIAGQYPARVSGGQRQRTAIARTLILKPDLLLMDEPFSSLDPIIRRDLNRTLLKLETEVDLTRLLVTHSIEEALELSDTILVLQRPPHTEVLILPNPQPPGSLPEEQNPTCLPAISPQTEPSSRQELAALLHRLMENQNAS